MILLTPGPCMTSEAVRQAAALPDLNHREPAFQELLHTVRRELLSTAHEQGGEEFEVFLVGGSGTAGMEAMATSTVNEGPVLAVSSGYYSDRMADIFDAHGMPNERLKLPWTEPWDFDQIEAALRSRRYEAVLACHHETTTGRLNDIERLGKLARQNGAKLLVDAVSSFGADPVPFAGCDTVCSSANKCLHGLPGVSFVYVKKALADAMESYPRRSYYLHLPMYRPSKPPLTPPVPVLRSFGAALEEFRERGGVRARNEAYGQRAEVLRDGLEDRGYKIVVPKEESSVTLLTARLPDGTRYEDFFQHSYRNGYVIYGAKGELSESHFQVSTMGEQTEDHVRGWLGQLP
jgi:2-aminoethylphosphonate-pyruvate transaminase